MRPSRHQFLAERSIYRVTTAQMTDQKMASPKLIEANRRMAADRSKRAIINRARNVKELEAAGHQEEADKLRAFNKKEMARLYGF